jgi:hypothetical protein
MLTHGVHEGRITLERLVQVCCENPARIYGLFPGKGAVAVGSDADLVVVDLSREVTVGPEHLNTRASWSIMEGRTHHGWPVLTLLRGQVTAEWADDALGPRPVGTPRGRYLPRDVLPDSDRKVFEAAGWGRPAGLGQRPALLVIDVNYNFVAEVVQQKYCDVLDLDEVLAYLDGLEPGLFDAEFPPARDGESPAR